MAPSIPSASVIVLAMSTSFPALGLPPELCEVASGLGFEQPTAIQAAAIPPLLAGRDVVGHSKTGSGKTAAFGLPLLARLDLKQRAPQLLVLCPTRELAGQVARELRRFGRLHAGLVVAELIGGLPKRRQREQLERGVHIAVGTPGRVLDHLDHDSLDPKALLSVVLDEADRMLDMGFEEEVTAILASLPTERQTALFSATLPEGIVALERQHLRAPVHVEGGSSSAESVRVTTAVVDGAGSVIDLPESLRQFHLACERGAELAALGVVLGHFEHESALVFCNFKATVTTLVADLARAGLSVDRIDGDLDQFERDEVLVRFRGGSVRVLVATDVAGRGLDIEGLDLVVNFELPQQPETYVHRIGRTGRAERQGVAVSLSRSGGDRKLQAIEELTHIPIARLDLAVPRGLDRSLARPAAMGTIRIAGGRRDKLRPGDLLGALTGDCGLEGADVGRIDVHEQVAYVAVRRELARTAAERLDAGRIKTRRFRATFLDATRGRKP